MRYCASPALYALCLLPLCALPFSPLVCFVGAFLCLFAFHNGLDSVSRVILGISLVLGGSVVYASRVYFNWEGDDFIRYYQTYKLLLEGNIKGIQAYGIECGLSLWHIALIALFGELSPAGLLFWTILPPSILFLIWLEKYAMQGLDDSQKAICIFLSFLFFDFYIASEYTRQFYSSIFILYALSVVSMRAKIAFSLLACVFHLSALLLLPPLFLLKKYPKFTLSLSLIALIVLSIGFGGLLLFYQAGILPKNLPLFDKLGFYIVIKPHSTIPNIIELFFIFLLFASFLLRGDSFKARWFYFVIFFLLLYFALLFVHSGIAHRSTILLTTILLGFLLFVGLRQFFIFLLIFCALAFIYKLKVMLFGRDVFWLFESYPAFGEWFYFIS